MPIGERRAKIFEALRQGTANFSVKERPMPNQEGPPESQQSNDDDRRRQVVELIHAEVSASSSFSGPLPPPDILAKYDLVVPGSAARILAMAETQSRHRRSLERIVVIGDSRRAWAGLWTGFTLGMTGLIVGGFLGFYGQQVAASVIGGGALASLVSVFVIGTKSRQQERSKKAKIMQDGTRESGLTATPTA
jgi:uncharacterized membrane protein